MTTTTRTPRLPDYCDEVTTTTVDNDGTRHGSTVAVISDSDAGFCVSVRFGKVVHEFTLAEVKALRDAFANVIDTANGR